MFEERLTRYLYERAEEARAVRVGEKETSEQAEIVARYADLFTREQHECLREEEDAAVDGEAERLYRLREARPGGSVRRPRPVRAHGPLRDRVSRRAGRVPRRIAAAPLGTGDARHPRRLRRPRGA